MQLLSLQIWGEQYSFAFVDKKKKSSKKMTMLFW